MSAPRSRKFCINPLDLVLLCSKNIFTSILSSIYRIYRALICSLIWSLCFKNIVTIVSDLMVFTYDLEDTPSIYGLPSEKNKIDSTQIFYFTQMQIPCFVSAPKAGKSLLKVQIWCLY